MMDYTFVTDPPFDMLTILDVYDIDMGMILPLVADEKGPIEYVIKSVCENISWWGRIHIVLRVDGEPAIKALAEAIKVFRQKPPPQETVIEIKITTPPQSNVL